MLAASQARIGDTIEGFYSDSSETAMVASTYKRSVEELDARTAKELDVPYRATVLDPISKLSSYFPEVNKLIEKRNRKLLDYDAARSKQKKLAEKPADDPSKLPRYVARLTQRRPRTGRLQARVRGDRPAAHERTAPAG